MDIAFLPPCVTPLNQTWCVHGATLPADRVTKTGRNAGSQELYFFWHLIYTENAFHFILTKYQLHANFCWFNNNHDTKCISFKNKFYILASSSLVRCDGLCTGYAA